MRTVVSDLVAEAAASRAAAPAVTYKSSTLTYGELWAMVRAGASGLRRMDLRKGDRVAVYLDKRVETVVAMVAAWRAGGVYVPVNPQLRAQQVRHILNDCAVRVLVTSWERYQAVRDEVEASKTVEHLVLVDHPPGDDDRLPTRGPAVTWWPDLFADVGDDVASTPVIDADLAAIFYTSGSTGMPKGVVLSHRNVIAGAEAVSGYLHNNEDDVILAALPLSFDAGLSQLTTGFCAGSQVVLMNYLLPTDVVRMCAQHQVTGLTCVPPLWIQLAEQQWPAEATRHMRYFANTGGRMPRPVLDKLRTIFPRADPYLMYGLTEAFRSTYLDPAEVDRRPDSIGKAVPNTEVLVVRPDGQPCEPGETGELVHRGALVALGYWNDQERTAERFRPAPGQPPGLVAPELAVWSGDLVVRDEEGFLYFVGRRDEMIKTSGYRVSPTEVEEAMYETGLVGDAVAVGVADELLGQQIVAVVTPAGGADLQVRSFLAELKRKLPGYMVPRRVVVRPELPRSGHGKFDRRLLRQQLAQESAS